MAHELLIVEIVLWIIVMVLLGIASVTLYKLYQKNRSTYTLGVVLFFLIFLVARICVFYLIFVHGYEYSPPSPDPIQTMLLIGNNITYLAVFVFYFGLEKDIVKTYFVFSVATLILFVIAILDNFVQVSLFIYEIPFFFIVIFGILGIYLYLAKKSSGQMRTNALLICAGMLILIFGIAFSIPSAQVLFWSKMLPSIVYELVGPILHIIGTIIISKAFYRSYG